jgi:hypothetical protein
LPTPPFWLAMAMICVFIDFTYNPIILDGNWIFPFSQLTLGIYFHL